MKRFEDKIRPGLKHFLKFEPFHHGKNKRRFFIETQGQNIRPSVEEEQKTGSAFIVKRRLIPFFMRTAFTKKEKDKYYLILADSGMGKTTFMINLYLRYSSFFNFRKKYKIKLRPMLLSYIDYLIDGNQKFTNTYQIYEALIEKWIEREADKRKHESTSREKFKQDLHSFSNFIAVEIYHQFKNNGNLAIDKVTATEIGLISFILSNYAPIKGGDFLMGSPENEVSRISERETQHPVKLSDFSMCKYAVTVANFKRFMDDNPSYLTDAEKGGGSSVWSGKEWKMQEGVNWRYDVSGKERPPSGQ